jgi:hypothetical protein
MQNLPVGDAPAARVCLIGELGRSNKVGLSRPRGRTLFLSGNQRQGRTMEQQRGEGRSRLPLFVAT